MYQSDASTCFPPEYQRQKLFLLVIIIAEVDSACSVSVCDSVALTGERIYPNSKDLTGTIQLDIAKQTKNMQTQNKKEKKKKKKKNFFECWAPQSKL